MQRVRLGVRPVQSGEAGGHAPGLKSCELVVGDVRRRWCWCSCLGVRVPCGVRRVNSPISRETWVRSAYWIPGLQTINATMGPVAAGPGEGKGSDDTHVQTARYQAARREGPFALGDRQKAQGRPGHGRQIREHGGLLAPASLQTACEVRARRAQAAGRLLAGGRPVDAAQAAPHRQARV